MTDPLPAEFEKLGDFFLGKTVPSEDSPDPERLVLYDSGDLTTHAVIIGMTGSGKTGLGVGLIEEAAIDGVPVIAIDPKGDLGNLLLTFPDLQPSDFRPWVDPRQAQQKGQTIDAYARSQAQLWQKGLASWAQGPDRIRRLREAADFAIYTPGSSAGRPLAVLDGFSAPPPAQRQDRDAYRERLQGTATGVLALIGISADPLTSREHILLTNILDNRWQQGVDLDLPALIHAVTKPPFERVGVFDLDDFYPPKDRMQLAMRLNNLLAAPGFADWMQGEPLDAGKLLYTAEGRPRVSIISIAHLGDAERMFIVTMLLQEIIGWMRSQSGTGSLRALLYMDEVAGYLPPSAVPPSKPAFLTMLKQARAFGLGLVLSTQNPVDLDYKALSNAGTWFIGRLQTERDKARVMAGLEGASVEDFDKAKMERILAGLGKRRFLLHSVHENEPVVFGTRWVMSYLAGPMTREQIRALSPAQPAAPAIPTLSARPAAPPPPSHAPSAPPMLETPPSVGRVLQQYFLPADGRPGSAQGELVYRPLVGAAVDVIWSDKRYKVSEGGRMMRVVEPVEGPLAVDWDDGVQLALPIEALRPDPVPGATFGDVPRAMARAKAADRNRWGSSLRRWVRNDHPLELMRSPRYRAVSHVGEDEGAFRARIGQQAREERDVAVGKLKGKYAKRFAKLNEQLRKAKARIGKEQAQSSGAGMDTGVSFTSALLSSLLGRRASAGSSVRSVGRSVRAAGRWRRQAGDVERARADVAAIEQQIAALSTEMQAEISQKELEFDPAREVLEPLMVRAKKTDIELLFVGAIWAPYRATPAGGWWPAWPRARAAEAGAM